MSLVSLGFFAFAGTIFTVGCIVCLCAYLKVESTRHFGSGGDDNRLLCRLFFVLLVAVVVAGIGGLTWADTIGDRNTQAEINTYMQDTGRTVIDYQRYNGVMLSSANGILYYSLQTECDGCEHGYMWLDYNP